MTSPTGRENDSVYDIYQTHVYDDYIHHNGSGAFIRKLLKKKWLILLMIMLPPLGGLVVGLSLHYTNSSSNTSPTNTPSPTSAPTTQLSKTAVLILSTRILFTEISSNKPMTVDFLGKKE